MKNFLIDISPYIITLLVAIILYAYYKNRGGTPYEKKLRKKWEAEQKENEEFRQASKPLTQQSFEEWKAEKRKRDQGGFVNLDVLAGLLRSWRV